MEVDKKEGYLLKEELTDDIIIYEYNIKVIEEDMEEVRQMERMIHEQYDSFISRCNQFLQQIKNGQTVNTKELVSTRLFSFATQKATPTHLKRHINLDITNNMYNIKTCKRDLKSLEHELRLTTQKMLWIEGCYVYQSEFCRELGKVVGVDISLLRDNLPYYCTVYSALSPHLEEFFNQMGMNAAKKHDYYLQVGERTCTISINRYYTCSILYLMVRTLLRIEMIIKEEDEFELYIDERKIENTDVFVDDLNYTSNEITLKVIPKEKKKRYFRYTITKLEQLKKIPDKTNYIVFDMKSYSKDTVYKVVDEFIENDFHGIEHVDIIVKQCELYFYTGIKLVNKGIKRVSVFSKYSGGELYMEETEETVSRIKGKILDKKHEIFELEDEIAYLTSQRDILDSGFYPR